MSDKQSEGTHSSEGPLRTIARVAAPYRSRLLLIALLAILSTGADLIEPLIYRVAVNDVAGLFVQKAQEETEGASDQLATPRPTPERTKPVNANRRRTVRSTAAPEPHRTDHVAGRTPSETLSTLSWAVGLLFVINVVGYFFWLLSDNMAAGVASKIEKKFIYRVFGHVLRLPLSFFGRRASGALAKRIDQMDQVSPIVNAATQHFAPEVIRVVGIMIIMLTQNWQLTLVALATLPIYLLIAWRSAVKLERGLNKYYELWEGVSARIQDALSAIKTVKLSGAETHEIERLETISDSAYQAYLTRTRLANRYLFWESFLTYLGKALVFAFGGYLAFKHELTPGDVVMFVAYLDRLYDPIDSLTSLGVELQQNVASLSRGLRLVRDPVEPQGKQILQPGPGRISFSEVHFGYRPEREVLRGLTLEIEAGKTTGIVGPSGAGKTTMIDLILGLYQTASGSITIDGQAISALDLSSLRSEVGVVAADGAVFRGTLADNIRYKRPNAADEEVRAAALAAGLASALERLPDGLETEVGEGGMGLSVGERQRLQLARVLLAAPRILILDEATANLDYATELDVKRTLSESRINRTTLIVAHRYSMVHDADRILVIEDGQVREQGTPAELTATGGWFAQLASGTNHEPVGNQTADESDDSESDDPDDEQD